MFALLRFLEALDRRVIYLIVALSLSLPLIFGLSLKPAEMGTAKSFFDTIESLELKENEIVLVAADWGPGTRAENGPQTESAIEHLMRKRIPFALISIYQLADPFLKAIPRRVAAKLEKEMPGEKWVYGKDWVNFGYQVGNIILIQSIAKSENIAERFKTDANGTPLEDIPVMKGIKTIRNIRLLIEVTGLVGAFTNWIQFFQADGYRPDFLHGCTSITIPEAYLYYSSKQIIGLFEGLAGVAWYDNLLSERYPNREVGSARINNSALAIAHLVVIAFIIFANIGLLARFFRRSE